MQDEPDVIAELLREHSLPQEGDYCGDILAVTDSEITKGKGTPYIKVKIGLGSDRNCYVFIAGYPASIKLAAYALPKMIGERVKIRIRHKKYDDTIYLDGTILEYLGK